MKILAKEVHMALMGVGILAFWLSIGCTPSGEDNESYCFNADCAGQKPEPYMIDAVAKKNFLRLIFCHRQMGNGIVVRWRASY